jgi:hypothetical protein
VSHSVPKSNVMSKTNGFQMYIDALDNAYTRRNYEIHSSEFKKALKASDSCNELLEMDGRELEETIVAQIKNMAKSFLD